METKTLSIMFMDLAGYTHRTAHISREKLLELLDKYDEIIEPILYEFRGMVVKKIGDAFMVVFDSPTDAILCGIKAQNTLFNYNKTAHPSDQIHVKIAINTGEVHLRDKDFYGEAVNIAARLEKVARVNDVYFTESVYLSMNKTEIPSVFVGDRRFKGIPRKVKVFKVMGEYNKILLARKRRKKQVEKRRKRFVMIMSIAVVLALLLAAAYLAQYYL